MSDLNVAALVGRISYDAIIRTTPAGTRMCTFGFASNRTRKKDDGTWEETPHFFTFSLFGSRAENIGPYLVKGQLVSITGHLVMDKWETKGEKHARMNLLIDDIRLLGSQKKDGLEKTVDADTAETEAADADYFPVGGEGVEADPDLDLGGFGEEPAEV
jgi:single-strand DNA-binding protein